jgi:hypothetical protein
MLNNYKKELIAIVAVFGLISYTIYVCAAEPVKAKPAEVKQVEPAKKATLTPAPAKKKEAAKPAEPAKKDPNRKKPTLKAKYADKK